MHKRRCTIRMETSDPLQEPSTRSLSSALLVRHPCFIYRFLTRTHYHSQSTNTLRGMGLLVDPYQLEEQERRAKKKAKLNAGDDAASSSAPSSSAPSSSASKAASGAAEEDAEESDDEELDLTAS